ncbi:thrombospondin type 3 repeat-containing protein [Candidatus Woesearchaeota archaeon]|nr:thrombospondin type 3 repeat-containing protein [Candidatus Woesearchaeota archaeon]
MEYTCVLGKKCFEDSDCASGLCGPNGKCVKKGDMDADGVPDEDDNCPLDANKNQADVDDDGIGDACDKDNDNDRIDDSWELEYGLDPEDPNDAEEDPDDDGLINHYEFVYGTNPFEEDTDGDGHSDAKEVDKESDPLDPDSTPSGGFGFILIILIILILGVVGFFGYRYYKKTLNSLPPPKKQAQQAAARPQPKKPQPPPQLSELPLASHKVFEQKEADKKADMEKVFDAFNTENTEKLFGSKPPAQKPKPTDNLFDKFAEIPLKSGDEVFEELKRNIEEEEKLRNKRK